MKKVVLGATLAALLLAIPAISLAGKGKLVAKDVDRGGNSLVAVATTRVNNPGEMRGVISTKPKRLKVDWIAISDCWKNGRKHPWPKQGTRGTTTSRSKVRVPIRTGVGNPDYCDVGISGKLAHKKGKKIVAKVFNKP